ncbi:insulinase family protein [Pimelobacter simplex]|uniref:Peptidase, M16 family n=1 Tax=Nocardioides simplex TaxID=2045 RepID=A0A0A1DKF8_NOCSI|nr:pitrilysin family protein [Pimelobacter simplex]AIY17117.1 peptidase, M16 family [Pimelobacter simplex]MCG8151722.1 insulinase family protein [Pimelobacter simplex]GEB13098.1 putative zinc protease [Pimelobacter simplex]SFM49478.1 Predicted Zn-dependent peptidase [Pimelobacter simplex]
MSTTRTTTAGQRSAGRPSAVPRASTRTLETVRDETGQVTSLVRRTQLASGLRIVTEQMAGARSASVGVWVGVGSRDETAKTHGASHFLEHLLFKGTTERSALDISIELDAVGGEFNAFTAKEYTCFHARVLSDDLPLAVDVLGDMITGSVIATPDVDAERDVILDEIAMHDDDPDDVVQNLLAALAWGEDSALGRPIAGTDASIEAMTPAQIKRFYRRHYVPANTVISVAGAVDHAAVVRAVKKAFARHDWLDTVAAPVAPRAAAARRRPRIATAQGHVTRPFEQVNLVLGCEGLTRDDERRYALGVLNTALGGGTSSRLFQEVREHRGLAYSVYSFAAHYADSGLVGVAVGCLPDRTDDVLAVVREQLAIIAAEGITADELARGKGQLVGGMILGLEDSGSRMMRLGKNELVNGEVLGIDEVIARIEGVTLEQVREVAAEVFGRPELLAQVGPGGA